LGFQQDSQTVGDIVGRHDSLWITLFLPKQANSSAHIAAMIGDDLHRHADLFAEGAEVSSDGFAIAASEHVQSEDMDVVMVGTVAVLS
jgi:hypothetical protein